VKGLGVQRHDHAPDDEEQKLLDDIRKNNMSGTFLNFLFSDIFLSEVCLTQYFIYQAFFFRWIATLNELHQKKRYTS
jgi:hypothetical protein